MLRILIRTGLAFICTFVVLMFFDAPRDGVLSVLMIIDMSAKDKPSLYKSLTKEPLMESDSIRTASGEMVRFDIYSVNETKPLAGMILTHGFTEKGKDDTRLQSMARRLARAGYIIMVPELTQMKQFRLSYQDVEQLTLCFNYLIHMKAVDTNKIGMMAFSFGTGPVLISMTQPQIRDRIKFGVMFGGYFDLKRTLKYTLTGEFDAEGYRGRVEVAGKNDRWRFLLGNAALAGTSREFEDAIRKKIDDLDYDMSKEELRLTVEQKNVLALIGNEDPVLFDSLYDQVPASFKLWIDTLSLDHYADQIRSQILIGHSDGDHVVHYSESLALSRHVPNAPRPFLVIMGLFTHVNLKMDWESLPAMFSETLPDLYRLWQFAFQILQQRR